MPQKNIYKNSQKVTHGPSQSGCNNPRRWNVNSHGFQYSHTLVTPKIVLYNKALVALMPSGRKKIIKALVSIKTFGPKKMVRRHIPMRHIPMATYTHHGRHIPIMGKCLMGPRATFTHRRHLPIDSIRYDAWSIRYLIDVTYGYLSRENWDLIEAMGKCRYG